MAFGDFNVWDQAAPPEKKVLQLVQPQWPLDDTLIPTLEGLLADVKAGRIVAIALAGVGPDGSIRTMMSPPHQHVFTLFGAIERLKLRFHRLHVMEPEEQ